MEEKKKFVLWMQKDSFKRMEDLYQRDSCKTKSQFIEKAVNYYCDFLTYDQKNAFLPRAISLTISGKMDGLENRLATLLFKMSVELSMLVHLFASTGTVNEELLHGLRSMCVDEVKRLHGSISLDKALRSQGGEE